MVIIARWLLEKVMKLFMGTGFTLRNLAVLCTAVDTSLAVANDLLGCDWLGRVRLIITRTVCRLAIATFAVATPSELFYWHVRYLHICLLCCV